MLGFILLLVALRFLQETCFDFGCIKMVLTLCARHEDEITYDINMTSDSQFMAFGYRVFLTFSWKNPDKNAIGCLIFDIWVSRFLTLAMEKSR